MLENLIKQATCIVNCCGARGTGQLVTSSIVLTARHCIISALEAAQPITLAFFSNGRQQAISATVIADTPEFDACLLLLSEPIDIRPIPLSAELPVAGSDWSAFGYPASKANIGHGLNGRVSQILTEPTLKMDIDLAVEPSVGLTEYSGMSGAGLICNGVGKGLICLAVDQGIGAISVLQLREFLSANQVPVLAANTTTAGVVSDSSYVQRIEFEKDFDARLAAASGRYVFLEGAHGIGKTTFCNTFSSLSEDLVTLGTYSLTSSTEGMGPAQRAQPEVFARWLETMVTELVTGGPARQSEKTYAQLIESCSLMLQEFAQHCVRRKQRGILFLDGLNEAHAGGVDALARLVGLLPMALPASVTIVFTAPNFNVMASTLAGRVRSDDVVALPALADDAAREYCTLHPGLRQASSTLITAICTKAKGHPLYLRYVIEYVAESQASDGLDDFPDFSGIIEDYYEVLWSRLQSDTDAVALLAIMARLRSSILLDEMAQILSHQEKVAFVGVISRIKHLLLKPGDSGIYHPSFAIFLVSKTSAIEASTHERIGNFCSQYSEKRYGAVNLIHHLLRSNEVHRATAISSCTQDWVDRCVTFGVVADTLLYDVDEVIGAAAGSPNAVDVIRLLLLSQRIRFRYNVLLAQSAAEVAEALIALGRPDDAFNHVVRFGVLVAPVEDSLRLAYRLTENGFASHAVRLLDLAYTKVEELYEDSELSIPDYLRLVDLDLRCLYLLHRADGRLRERQLSVALGQTSATIDATFGENEEGAAGALTHVRSSLFSTIITLGGNYTSILRMGRATGNDPESILNVLVLTVLKIVQLSEEYGSPLEGCCPPTMLEEIAELLAADLEVDENYFYNILDAVILCGGPVSLVNSIVSRRKLAAPEQVAIKDKDGVSFQYHAWHDVSRQGCAASFVTSDDLCPEVLPLSNSDWLQTFDDLTRALAWCEGKARRAAADEDVAASAAILLVLEERILKPLDFTLGQRMGWEHSYFVPEQVMPVIYDRIFLLYLSCFRDKLDDLFHVVHARLPNQFGIYSEGFRRILQRFVAVFKVSMSPEASSDGVFPVVLYWRDYVLRNVQNRHELVPELLQIIPAMVHWDASELAGAVYQDMLNVSMGPSWYKEDQLELMNSALRGR